VVLAVPPHAPSTETLAAVAVGVAGLVEVAAGLAEVAAGFAEVAAPLPPQLPKAVLQPVPQWSVDEPQ
jgi:hypothetical protein